MAPDSLSVLFLTRYPVEGASSRYRVYQYVPYLERLGIRCTVQSFMDGPMYGLSQRPGQTAKKLFRTLRATLARLRAVARWKDYDIIYLQRELLPFGPPIIERWLARRGAVLFFDYDDALFIKKASRYNRLATFFRSPDKTREMFRLVHCTVAGNDWLRDAARNAGGHAVTVEVAEDTSRYQERDGMQQGESVTIGWLGSPSTVKYLRLIEAPLRRIAERYPDLRWEVMGGGDFDMPGIDWQGSEWSLEGERQALARFDIGLMPLPMEEWSRGKSGGKARTYMAAAVVPVVSAIGYNLELIRDGETGFLCTSGEDWEAVLSRLIEDAALRRRVAIAAREEVEWRFAPEKQAAKLAALFRNAVDREAPRD